MYQLTSTCAFESLYLGALTVSADMIREDEPITNYYISMPKEYSRINVAAYIAGMIRGMLVSATFVRRPL